MYEFAKIDESTRVQMKAIIQYEDTSELHAVRSRKKPSFFKKPQQQPDQRNIDSKGDKKLFKKPFKFKSKGCFRCGGNHDRSADCPVKFATCKYCGKQGHFLKVCLKRNQRVHQIGTSDGTSETTGATNNDVFLGTLASEENLVQGTLSRTVHSVSSYAKRIYVFITLNDQHKMKLKVDTGADICAVSINDLQDFPFPVNIKKDSILKGYSLGTIKNISVTDLNVTFRNKSINTKFNVVYAPGKPSVIRCAQAQKLGIITVNIDEIESNDNPAKQAAAQGKLTKELIPQKYKDCFDKVGRFPGEKYHIQLIDNPVPVIHAPRTVPVHILPLYKAELEKM